MSERKEFVHTEQGYVLIGDSRDIAVPYIKRQQVHAWCEENKITAEYQGTLGGTDLWRVRDDDQRAWFALRWS